MATIFQGDDPTVQITLDDGTTTINLTATYANVVVYALDKLGKTIVKFSKETRSGYETMTYPNTGTDGLLQFLLQSDATKVIVPGNIAFEVKVQETNTDFDNDTEHTVALVTEDTDGNKFTIQKAATKNDTVL